MNATVGKVPGLSKPDVILAMQWRQLQADEFTAQQKSLGQSQGRKAAKPFVTRDFNPPPEKT